MSEPIKRIIEKRETLCRRLIHYEYLKGQIDRGCTTPVGMAFKGFMADQPLALSPDVVMMMIETTIRNLEEEIKTVENQLARMEKIAEEGVRGK